MGTVTKALELLELLRAAGHKLGLSELARQAGFDKATTRRLLVELVDNGLVEQDPRDKSYDLGPALQTLGRAREQRFPLYRIIEPVVRALAEQAGETVHAAEYSAGGLSSICIEHSQHSNRVILDRGQRLPLHATASGLAFLAAAPPSLVDAVAAKPLTGYTGATPISPDQLAAMLAETRRRGYSYCDQLFEVGVSSVAAAIRNALGRPIGTIAVALPSSRCTAGRADQLGRLVQAAAREVGERLAGGRKGA